MELISLYHRYVVGSQQSVDDRTWQDLGMDDLFAKIDRTAGMPGAQVLYHQMRVYEVDDRILAERLRQQDVLRKDAGLREKMWPLLARLNNPGMPWLAPLLLNPITEYPRHAWLLYLLSFFSLVALVGMVFFPPLLLAVLGMFFINLIINQTYGRKITPYFPGFAQIDTLLGVAEALGKIPDVHQLPQLKYLREKAPMIAGLRKRFGWFVIARNAQSELAQAMLEYLNLLFLFDILVFIRSLTRLRQHREALIGVLGEVGCIDASLSVASYVTGVSKIAVPTLVDGRHLEVRGLYHPLISTPVGNSLCLTDRSVLVSGSNMAGKTTFIRTVGINLILARTLAICHADRAVFPRAIVHSSIRREDQLSDGQSYFFAEVDQIRAFISTIAEAPLQLFLIDEIFRGTNTIERISASAAVLRHLAGKQMVLVTTHDLELQELLSDTFDMYHFSERFEGEKCIFDYHIHSGPARSRNAIKLLEISNYPESITKEARSLAEQLSVNFDGRPKLPQGQVRLG